MMDSSQRIKKNDILANVAAPQVDSFNSMIDSLLRIAVSNLSQVYVQADDDADNTIKISLANPRVALPTNHEKATLNSLQYPTQSIETHTSYKALLQISVNIQVNDNPIETNVQSFGYLPIMVRSAKCNLASLSPEQLIAKHEDPQEFGGYFITNGIQRLIRLLIVPRRNYPIGLVRTSFENRGPTFSKFGVQTRSVRDDQTSQSTTLHYLTDGAVYLRFSFKKNEYLVPILIILYALNQTSDKEIFERIVTDHSNTFLTDRIEMLLRSHRKHSLYTQRSCLEYLGSKFAVMLDSPEYMSEEEVGLDFLHQVCFVHLSTPKAKFDYILFNLQKLYSLVSGDYGGDNPDALQFQETLLSGHLYLAIVKEKLNDWLSSVKLQIKTDLRRARATVDFKNKKYLSKVFQRTANVSDIGKKVEYFLSTGNLITTTGLDLQQTSGYTIIAEKLNFYRYIAHFRSIHRGAFFAQLKTTTVRKLLPESWGFLCPVHTPDGAPCGLLNHLSRSCEIVTESINATAIPSLVISLGANPTIGAAYSNTSTKKDLSIMSPLDIFEERSNEILSIHLDGRVIGWAKDSIVKSISRTLRDWKVRGLHNVPIELEIGYVPPSKGGQYPGLYLFSTPARMIRKVKYLNSSTFDYVGPFEQVYMDIACMSSDIIPGITTHQEFDPTDILSVVASLTPFSDFNQSPRNIYQCQMGKQTMGTPALNLVHRTDNKLYRLQTGQSPIVRAQTYDEYGLDEYPNGMNAVVCVISYTGYDMEDASILAKSSFERGYGAGSVYKGEWIDLTSFQRKGEPISHFFGFHVDDVCLLNDERLDRVLEFLDFDGLPLVGGRVTTGDPLYCYVDEAARRVKVVAYKGGEDAYIDQVRVIGTSDYLQKIHIKLRVPRPPIIGDKFSSRHGQKGVVSQKWPSIDMPFSESGIIPDVIINPHAFPSRMTIGMFIESLAGKSGALHGINQDATAFRFNEENAAADYFGTQLAAAGFNYHGNEPMYSGITGEEFKVDIYIGVVYYQRLRHMVSDKYQVRTTGPVHNLTQQPVKGRKRMGGIRLGEMERDSLLAHGISFILQDRLMNCSDYTQCHICRTCGSILTPIQLPDLGSARCRGEKIVCKMCGHGKGIEIVAIPYVFRYLCTELVSMNVRLTLEC